MNDQSDFAGAGDFSRAASAIARGVSRALRELTGRGPERIRVYLNGEVVTCVMYGEPSRTERALISGGNPHAVAEQRRTVLTATADALSAIVEDATGRRVTVCLSDTAITPDLTIMNFVLAP